MSHTALPMQSHHQSLHWDSEVQLSLTPKHGSASHSPHVEQLGKNIKDTTDTRCGHHGHRYTG